MKHIQWSDIDQHTQSLIKQIDSSKYNSIYGVPRGGLILAVILSHQFKIPLITEAKMICEDTLICDDICDSGKTLLQFNQAVDSCMLYKRYNSCTTPTYYAQEIQDDEWLLFPWEREDSQAIQDYKQEGS